MGGYFWAAFLAIIFSRTRFLDTAAWFLHDIACPLSLMVAILYWGMGSDAPVTGISVNFHGVNALLMAIDLALSRYPYHLKHFLPAAGFIVSYLIFNGLFWRYTGTVIYGPLNYSMMLLALGSVFGALFVILPCTHLLCWRWELGWFAYSEKRRYLLARKTSVEDLIPSPYNAHRMQQKKEEEQQEKEAEEEEEMRRKRGQQSGGGEEDLQRNMGKDMEEGGEGGVVPLPPPLSDRVLATRRIPSLEDYDEEGREGREDIREEVGDGPRSDYGEEGREGKEGIREEVGDGRGGVVVGDEEDTRYVTAAVGGATGTATAVVTVERLKE